MILYRKDNRVCCKKQVLSRISTVKNRFHTRFLFPAVFLGGSKERDLYFDNLKGLLIYLVFVGHMLSIYRDTVSLCNFLFLWIYAFHMPLFFCISGYFSKNVQKARTNAFEKLILPAIPFELLYFLLHWVTKADNFQPFLTPIFAYWYVFALFFARVLMPYLQKIRFILPISFLIALGIGFNNQIGEYMTLSRFFCMMPFFLIGFYTNRETVQKLRTVNLPLALLCGVLASLLLYVEWKKKFLPLEFDMSGGYETPIGLVSRVFQYLLAVLFFVFVLRIVPSKKTILARFGQASLLIYFLNFYFVAVYEKLFPISASSFLLVPVLLILSVFFCVIISLPICNYIFAFYQNILKKMVLKQDYETLG